MAFASSDDIATRLKRTFDIAEEALADLLIESAMAVIAAEAGKSWEWAEELPEPVHPLLRAVCIEVVVRVMENPEQLHSLSEQLGAHQESKAFRRGDEGGGLTLSERESRLIRFAINGTVSGYSRADTLVDRLVPETEETEL